MTQFETHVNGFPADLISVDQAVVEFAISRSTLFRILKEQGLAKFRRAGDRKSYVSRSELQKALGFKKVEDDPK